MVVLMVWLGRNRVGCFKVNETLELEIKVAFTCIKANVYILSVFQNLVFQNLGGFGI